MYNENKHILSKTVTLKSQRVKNFWWDLWGEEMLESGEDKGHLIQSSATAVVNTSPNLAVGKKQNRQARAKQNTTENSIGGEHTVISTMLFSDCNCRLPSTFRLSTGNTDSGPRPQRIYRHILAPRCQFQDKKEGNGENSRVHVSWSNV